jgi:hypothetical protein
MSLLKLGRAAINTLGQAKPVTPPAPAKPAAAPPAPARPASLKDSFSASAPVTSGKNIGAINPEFVAIDISTAKGKQALVSSTSQVNSVSIDKGNSGAICSGAAIANALILSAEKPGALKANADALRKVAGNLNVGLSEGESRALEHMAKGKLSPDDLAMIQQVSYRVAVSQNTSTDNPKLATAGDMGFAATLLRAEGAFKDGEVTFSAAKLPPGKGLDANHWTTYAGGKYVSSLDENGDAGTELKSVPPQKYARHDSPDWRGSVKVSQPADIDVAWPARLPGADKNLPGVQMQVAVRNAESFKKVDGGNYNEQLRQLTATVMDSKAGLIIEGDPFENLRGLMNW